MGAVRGHRLLAPSVALVLVLLCAGCDWTQYGGNAALTGNALDETTISAGNVAQLTETSPSRCRVGRA